MTVTDTPSAETSDRMQALLSRAVEEQVSEQRAVSTVLTELRDHISALEQAVRGAAANESVQRLDEAVTTVVADQRTATTLLSQRLETLAGRVEALAALGDRVDAQAAALGQVESALEDFASFPQALSSLQRDVSGVHDRLAPLAELRAAVADLTARTTTSLDGLRPQLEALASAPSGEGPDPDRVRDAVVDALSIRLERLQQAADRPVVGPEALRAGFGDIRAGVTAAVGQQLDTLHEAVSELGGRVDHLGERVGESTEAAGAVPGLSGDLQQLADRVQELHALRQQLQSLAEDVHALRDDDSADATTAVVAALGVKLEELTARVAQVPALSVDEISGQVSMRVADRLVETLAPRIADVVLTRVSAALVGQLAQALEPTLRAQSQESVRAVVAESETRVLAHVDEGLLTLAEALLRRGPVRRGPAKAAPAPAPEPGPGPHDSEPVHEVLERLAAEEPEHSWSEPDVPAEPARPAVTTGLAPSPVTSGVTAPASAASPESLKKADAPGLATAQVPAEVVPDQPTGKAGSAPAATPSRKAAAKAVAKEKATKPAAKAAPKQKRPAKPAATPTPKPAKPAAKPAAKSARPPAKRPARPQQPLLERPHEGDPSDFPPVRPPSPRPAASPGSPLQPPPLQPSPPPPPTTVLPPTPATRAPEKPKRKPWWRPGG